MRPWLNAHEIELRDSDPEWHARSGLSLRRCAARWINYTSHGWTLSLSFGWFVVLNDKRKMFLFKRSSAFYSHYSYTICVYLCARVLKRVLNWLLIYKRKADNNAWNPIHSYEPKLNKKMAQIRNSTKLWNPKCGENICSKSKIYGASAQFLRYDSEPRVNKHGMCHFKFIEFSFFGAISTVCK